MGLVNSNFRETTLTQSWVDSVLTSTYDSQLMPQTYGELVERYGDGLKLMNFLHLAGRVMGVKSPNITIFEKGAPSRPVKVSIVVDTAPIAVTVVPDAVDGSAEYLRAGFDIVIPKAYTDQDHDVNLRLTESGGTWTGTAYDVSAAITTGITDKYLFCGASSWGYGTNQPEPMASGFYTRTTNERILKDTTGIEGGQIYQEKWAEIERSDGSKGVWTRSIGEMDFRLDDQIDSALLLGEKNTNTANLTATSVAGGTSAIPSAEGLIPIMKSLAQELEWTTDFDIDKFRAVKALLENVGVVNKKVDFFVGTDLNANIETSMIDFLKAYSTGHSFYDEINKVGFVVKTIDINNVKFYLNELGSFSNPNKYGLSEYGYRNMGFMFTQGEYNATLDMLGEKQEMRLPHLTLGYPDGKGENRQRVFKLEPGMNGINGTGSIVANGYDGVKIYTMAHIVPIWNHMYKTILVEKSGEEVVA